MVTFAIIVLTHRGHVMHVSVNQTIFGSDNGSVPSHYLNQCLLIGPLVTNVSEIVIKIHHFSLKKIRMKMSSAKWRPYCHGLTWCMSHTELLWLFFLPHIKWQVWRRLTRSPTWYWCMHFNSLRPERNGRHIVYDIFNCIFLGRNSVLQLEFHWSLFLNVQMLICVH